MFFASDYWSPTFFAADYYGIDTTSVTPSESSRVDPRGGRGVGCDPTGTHYPFLGPSSLPSGVIADFYLWHDQPNVVWPLRIATVRGLDAALGHGAITAIHEVDLTVVDHAGTVVLDTTLSHDYTVRDFSPRLRVHEWQSNTTVCRLVTHNAAPAGRSLPILPTMVVISGGLLDPRTVELAAPRVSGLSAGGVAASSIVELHGGSNVVFTLGSGGTTIRPATRVTLDIIPGKGSGRYVLCTSPGVSPVTTINDIAPDDLGNIDISADGCFWTRQPYVADLVGITPGFLQIGNDCGPPCSNDDYVAVGRAIARIWNADVAIAARLVAINASYAALVTAWNVQKSCREARALRHNVVLVGRYLYIIASACNSTTTCGPATVRLDLSTSPTAVVTPAGGSIASAKGYHFVPSLYVLNASASNVYSVSQVWSESTPQTSNILKGAFYVAALTIPGAITVTVTITGTVNGVPVVGDPPTIITIPADAV